jgi:hypothetical protein
VPAAGPGSKIGDARAFVDEPLPADFGPVAASRLETVAFGGWPILVPPPQY